MKSKIIVISICVSLCVFSLWGIFKPIDVYSDSERRYLEGFPSYQIEDILSAQFMNDFEGYALDQFPLRDTFRKVKAFFNYHIFQRLDNNKIISKDGYLSKLEYPLNETMLQNAIHKFNLIYEQYLKDSDTNLYFSIVPDKNYYLIEDDYIKMDYQKLKDKMIEGTSYMEYIDLFNVLELEDYYLNDTHWKQEKLENVSTVLKDKMHASYINSTYEHHLVMDKQSFYPFYGVYAGQFALPVNAERLYYLSNAVLDACHVYSYSSGKKQEISMYSMEKAYGKDGYEMFLNGSEALLTIENPNAKTTKELIVFRDSFGSSIAPLLVDAYAKVTLVDIRYMDRNQISNYIHFTNQDVLFLYSTILLNNSIAFK